jgi:2-polyprenyl-3-methyl-5-hydroxy-6-metoxy-1,4-benzoquinol methylase
MKTYSKRPGSERTVEVPCAVCGAREPEHRFSCDGFGFSRCRRCGLVYQNPQPVFDDLRHRYDEEYFSYETENEEKFLELMILGLRDIRFDSISEGLPIRRFLDVGCATGSLIERLGSLGWETEGVELCASSARYGRSQRGLSIHTGTLQDARFPDARFSCVHASHLIEHLNDPSGFLREVHRVLIPGGFLILVTPNAAGLQARLFGAEWRSAIADHLYLFSPRTLGRLLRNAAFEVLRVRTWGGIAAGLAPDWIKRPVDRLAKRLGFGDVMILLARTRESRGPDLEETPGKPGT